MLAPHSRLLFAAVPAAGLALIAAGGVASGHGTSIKADAELGPYTTPRAGDDRVTVRPLPIGQTYSIVIHALSNPDRAPAGEPGHPGPRIACGDLEADAGAGAGGTVFVT